jgi:ferric-dicitrate binding protein FerR (iron transport regulator)
MNYSPEDDPTAVAALLGKAGRRAQPPPQTRDAVYATALSAWQQTLQKKRQQRQWIYALAASCAAAAVSVLWYATASREPLQVAAWSDGSGDQIRVDELVRVSAAPGRVLMTPAGERLRAAVGSEFVFQAPGQLQLRAGAIYVEAASTSRGAGLVIETRFGTVRHIGTRYAVAVATQQMTVSVREGKVAIATTPQKLQVDAGVQIRIDNQGREIGRQWITSYGAPWSWTEGLAPALQIDGRLLYEVLQDIAVETGRRLEFADEDVRLACGQIRLKGPFLDMPASDRLFAVLVTTGLEATESGERIQIQRQPGSAPTRPVSN